MPRSAGRPAASPQYPEDGSPRKPLLSVGLRNFSNGPTEDWEKLLSQARAADEAGVQRLYVSDHVAFGESTGNYSNPALGGIAGGQQPTGSDGLWLEPLTLLAVICGQTTRIRLATGILLAALRRPVVLAKVAATLDVLSAGRLDLGVGVGWQREEYEAAGLSFEGRGGLLDEALAICESLWTSESASFSGNHVSFEHIHSMPKPMQTGGVPIWVSGTLNPRVLARIVRFGSGWIPWGPDIADVERGIAIVHEALSDAGRDAKVFDVRAGLPVHKDAAGNIDVSHTVDSAEPLIAAGATDLLLGVRLPGEYSADLDLLSGLVEAFAPLIG